MRQSHTEELDLNLESPEFALDMHIMTITELFDTMSKQNRAFSFFNYYNFNICKDTDLEDMMENTEPVFGRHGLEKRVLHRNEFIDDLTISEEDKEQIRKNIEELYNRLFMSGREHRNERMVYADYFIINKRIHPELLENYPSLTENEIRNIFMKHLWTFVDVNRRDTSINGKLVDTYVNDDLILEPQRLEQKTLKYMEFATGLLENIDFDNYLLVSVEYPFNIFDPHDDSFCFDSFGKPTVISRFQRKINCCCVYFYKSDAAYCVYIIPEDEDVIEFLQTFQKRRFKQPERYGYTVVSRELFNRIRVGF